MESDSMISPIPTGLEEMEVERIDYSESTEMETEAETETEQTILGMDSKMEQVEGNETEMVDITQESELKEEAMEEKILERENIEIIAPEWVESTESITGIAEAGSLMEQNIDSETQIIIDYSEETPTEGVEPEAAIPQEVKEGQPEKESEIIVTPFEIEEPTSVPVLDSIDPTTTLIEPTELLAPTNSDIKGKGKVVSSIVSDLLPTRLDSTSPTPTCLCTKLMTTRPHIKRNLLNIIQVEDQPDPFPSTSTLAAPSIQLFYNNMVYSLFQPSLEDSEPVLFGEVNEQSLYFEKIGVFMEAIRNLKELDLSGEEELILNFPEIGIILTEDNVYTQKVSLHDFNRIHFGCGLPYRLSILIEFQNRFVSNFNTLLEHIKAETEFAYIELQQSQLIETTEEDSTNLGVDFSIQPDSEETVSTTISDGQDEYDHDEVRSETFEVPDESVLDEEFETETLAYEEGFDELVGEYDQELPGEGEFVNGEAEQNLHEEGLENLDEDDLVALVEGAIEDLGTRTVIVEEIEEKEASFEEGELDLIVEKEIQVVPEVSEAIGVVQEPVESNFELNVEESVEGAIISEVEEVVAVGISVEIYEDSPATVGTIEESIPVVAAAEVDSFEVSVEAVDDSLATEVDVASPIEEPALVIDYDEVFEPVASESTAEPALINLSEDVEVVEIVETAAVVEVEELAETGSKSPKRTRDLELDLPADAEVTNGHSKRPKLAEEISL